MTSQELFEQLEQRRESLCIDVVSFCKMVGIGRTGYYNWKRGIAPKGIEDAIKIFNFLNGEE